MADATSSWKNTGSKITELGSTLKGHYDKQRETEQSARADVGDALKKIGGVLQDAVDAVRDAAKDPVVRDEVFGIGKSFGSAVTVTVDQVSGEVKHAFNRRKGASTSSAPGTPPPAAWTEGPVQDVPAQDVPAQDVPAQDVPAQDVPAQDATGPDLPPKV